MNDVTGTPRVLFLDDEARQREIIGLILREAGYEVELASQPIAALNLLQGGAEFDVVITDLRMPLMDGIEFLTRAREIRPDQAVIVTTAHGSVATAVDAVRRGAFDYLEKPLDRDDFILAVERSARHARLVRENRLLHAQADVDYSIPSLVGHDGSIREVARFVRKVAPTSTTVAIYGETGTGKELVARAVHQLSPRSARPFFAINCASIPESLLESELFGYEKGAFTGADVRRRGLFEQASGSTLLLDEIGDLPLNLQGKILRVLQEREIRRLGAGEPVPVDVRILSATRRDLSKMVAAGAFREDLYYRINTFPIQIPPLRERLADLPALVSHFLEKFRDLRNPPVEQVSPSAMDSLAHYSWPGNVRELSACIERAVILAEGTLVDQLHLPPEIRTEAGAAEAIRLPAEGVDFEELERSLLIQALERTGGVATRAAPLLGMSYRTFQYRLHKHEIGGDGDRRDGPVQDESPDEEVVDEEP